MTHIEHGNLSVEANARARDQRLFVFDAGAVHRVARSEVVAAIEHNIGLSDALLQRIAAEALTDSNDFNIRIDFQQGAARGNGFRNTDGIVAMHDLPLQIGEVDNIAVAQCEFADATRGEIKRSRRPKAAGSDNQCMGLIKFFLTFYAQLRKQNVPAVA